MADDTPSTPSNGDVPPLAQPEPCTDDTTDPTSRSTEDDDSSQEEPTPGVTAPDTDSTDTCAEKESSAVQSDPSQDTEHNDGDDTSQDGTHSEEDISNAPSPQENPEPPTAPAPPVPSSEGRLAPGALRQMVIDHLQAHPAEAFTATRISRIIERSSGAIANALDKLVSQGIAEQVNDRARTFRLAQPGVNIAKQPPRKQARRTPTYCAGYAWSWSARHHCLLPPVHSPCASARTSGPGHRSHQPRLDRQGAQGLLRGGCTPMAAEWRELTASHNLAHSIRAMDKTNSAERQDRSNGRVVLSTTCALLIVGLFWGVAWKLDWWTPGFGMLSAKMAAMVSVGIVALVALVAWFAKRR